MIEVCHCADCDRPEPLLDANGDPVECDSCSTLLVEGQKRFCSRKCARAAEADNDDG